MLTTSSGGVPTWLSGAAGATALDLTRRLCYTTTPIDTGGVATTVDTNIFTCTLKASSLGNRVLRVVLWGTFLQNQAAPGNSRIKVFYDNGGTTMYDSVVTPPAQSATVDPWIITMDFVETASNGQTCVGYYITGNTTAATTGLGALSGAATTSQRNFACAATAVNSASADRVLTITWRNANATAGTYDFIAQGSYAYFVQ